jgi:hypothetical protein
MEFFLWKFFFSSSFPSATHPSGYPCHTIHTSSPVV